MIKRIYQFLFLGPETIGLDNYLGLILSFLASIVSLIGTIVNLLLGMDVWITLSTSVTFIFFTIAFYEGRIKKHLLFSKITTLFLILLALNVQWFLNFGSYGPILYMFVFIQPFIILMLNGWKRIFMIVLIVLNVSFLFLIEYAYPDLIKLYPDRISHLVDLYVGVLIYLALTILLFSVAINFYIKQTKKAEHADSLKSAFLANITHEIRTPMNAVLGFSQLLEKEISEDKRKKYIKIINENGQYLVRLIEDILDISKIEANQLEITFTNFNVGSLINEVNSIISQYLIKIEKQHVRLIQKIDDEAFFIYSDKDRLKQILTNLLSNASKFTEQGSITFGFNRLQDCLEFFVEDTGIGIKKEHLEEIFIRFHKIKPSGDNINYRGTGIGLSISKQLVELLGGTITFQSEYGVGTKFTFKIPYINQIDELQA